MKVLALMSSPRKGGNTDTLTDKALEGCRAAGAEVEKVVLRDGNVELCIACGKCQEAKRCVPHPNANALLDKIKAADAVLLATPVWWFVESSYLKVLLDHFIVFMDRETFACRIPGKRFAMITVCGAPAEAGLCERLLARFQELLQFLRADYRGDVAASGVNEPGAVAQNTAAMNAAFELGRKLAAQ